jgi:hypothetical protein
MGHLLRVSRDNFVGSFTGGFMGRFVGSFKSSFTAGFVFFLGSLSGVYRVILWAVS